MHKENDMGKYFAFGETVSIPAKIINSFRWSALA